MASQRHKREHNFFFKSQADGDPRQPRDVSEETPTQHDEIPAWPNEKRNDDTP